MRVGGTSAQVSVGRLVFLVAAVIFVSDLFYAAISPLLPYYIDELGLSKASAGILAGSYGLGIMVASLPAGRLSVRFGPRLMLIGGLALVAGMSVVFGLTTMKVLLDLSRFGQGVGSAVAWTGGMAWVSTASSPGRRGAMLAYVTAAAAAGQVLGPVLGAAGRAFGPPTVFAGVGAASAVLLVALVRLPTPPKDQAPAAGSLATALAQPAIRQGIVLLACIAMVRGAIDLFLPIHLDAAGASAAVLAGVFVITALVQVGASPWGGRHADVGRWKVSVWVGLTGGAIVVALVPVVEGLVPLGLLGICVAPAAALIFPTALLRLSRGAESAGIDHAYGLGLASIAWAGGHFTATTGGGFLAERLGDAGAAWVIAAAIAVAVVAVTTPLRGRRTPDRPRPGPRNPARDAARPAD